MTNVEKPIKNLNNEGILDPEKLHKKGVSEIAPLIKSTRFYNEKAIKIKNFMAFFFEDGRGGIGNFSLIPSTTPLNVTITPSEYVEKHILEFPSVVSITADPSLAQGYYPIDITINGAILATAVLCKDSSSGGIIGPGFSSQPPP